MLLRRPRNVNSVRAASILYGDWGTSKAARNRMVRLLRGDMVVRIAEDLPEEIKLLIYG